MCCMPAGQAKVCLASLSVGATASEATRFERSVTAKAWGSLALAGVACARVFALVFRAELSAELLRSALRAAQAPISSNAHIQGRSPNMHAQNSRLACPTEVEA